MFLLLVLAFSMAEAQEGSWLETFNNSTKLLQKFSSDVVAIVQIEVDRDLQDVRENEQCYGSFGCVHIGSEWYHSSHRPINLFPEFFLAKFYLNTREEPKLNYELISRNDSSLNASTFQKDRPLKVIIHGFVDTGLTAWLSDMSESILLAEDVNVVLIDWGVGSLPPYTQAVANTRLVALQVIDLLKWLHNTTSFSMSKVHIIGFSLGAQIAGYVGEKVRGIQRITGLDPASPYFQGMPPFVRLDPSDANFVDVTHTDCDPVTLLGFGYREPCGHVDFYPNDGYSQPGCKGLEIPNTVFSQLLSSGVDEASRGLLACSHYMAIKLFVDSIHSKCPYIGHQCPNYEDFLSGTCDSCSDSPPSCLKFGYYLHAPPSSNDTELTYFFSTGDEEQLCLYHYRLIIKLSRPSKANPSVKGFLKLESLRGNRWSLFDVDLTDGTSQVLTHGKSFGVLISSERPLGVVKSARIHWEYDTILTDPSSYCILWCNPNLYVQYLQVVPLDKSAYRGIDDSAILCSKDNSATEIRPGDSASFYSSEECNSRFGM